MNKEEILTDDQLIACELNYLALQIADQATEYTYGNYSESKNISEFFSRSRSTILSAFVPFAPL